MKRFNNFRCMVEHGEAGKPALDLAVTLAEHNQSELTVVDVIPRMPAGIGMPDGGPISRDLRAAMISEHEAGLFSLIEPSFKRLDVEHGVLIPSCRCPP